MTLKVLRYSVECPLIVIHLMCVLTISLGSWVWERKTTEVKSSYQRYILSMCLITIVVNFEVVLSGFSTVVTLSFALFLLSFESSLEKSTLEEWGLMFHLLWEKVSTSVIWYFSAQKICLFSLSNLPDHYLIYFIYMIIIDSWVCILYFEL